MSERPIGWQSVVSGDLFEFVTSGSRGWAKYYSDDGPLFIRVGNLDHDTIQLDLSQVQAVQPPDGAEGLRTRLRPDDIVISITAELGMVGLVPRDLGDAYINQHVALARPRRGLDSSFLAWFFAAEGKRQLLEMRRGATKAGLGLDDIRRVDVGFPPLPEQRRIVAKIEALQERSRAAREALDAIPPLLDRFRQSVLAAAFRGDLTADWRANHPDVEPASVLLERIRIERRRRWEEAQLAKLKAKGKEPKNDKWKTKYKEPEPVDTEGLPELPEGWCWSRLEQLASFHNGDRGKNYPNRSEYVPTGLPFVNAGHIDADGTLAMERMNYITSDKCASLGGGHIESGDLLFCIRGTLGKTATVNFDGGAIASSLVIIRPYEGQQTRLLLHFLQSPLGRDEIDKYDNGTAQPNLSANNVKQFLVPVPPADEGALILERIDQMQTGAVAAGSVFERSLSQLERLDQSILAKAFRGELVPQDPNDEPASVLLERIRAEREAAAPKKKTRGRRSKKTKAKKAAASADDAEPAPASAKAPTKPKRTEQRRTAIAFLDLDTDDQIDLVFDALVSVGLLEIDDAIRHVADHLRESGASHHQRLRRGGGLHTAIEDTLKLGARRGYFDRPRRGHVRALLAGAKEYQRDHWRAALLASLDGEPVERHDALRDAADWAAENMGLEFKRLRSDGVIMKGLKSALNSAIRRGEVERVGGGHVRKKMVTGGQG